MRWQGGRESENVEDRRGGGGFGGFSRGGGLGGIPIGRGGLGIGGVVVVLLLGLVFGVDPSVILSGGDPGYEQQQTRGNPRQAPRSGAEDELKRFVSVVLADTEDTWHGLFQGIGRTYQDPTLVLFSGAVDSACGMAQAAVGPFYCPADRKLYIDLSFYRDLRERFRAPGDFAQAYVVAHEVGHHVQTLLGISQKVREAQRGAGQGEANALSVRLELQADCFAGLWANAAQRRGVLEPGDVEEALTAASAIGDDRLQRQARGTVTPDSFTHGSSDQRVRWFRQGLSSGELRACDTFAADRL
ncbi:neutral zinc metallopeptidase [Azospirillum sp.]|uniref:KPN_02809 family neutral zinc metallopeptidase n=1 Tax=Azospirillum sp. TaxID=34012 RepID=UPI002D36FB35|nr:neutral zinc metallopeptidase [Azospirillum sp.]HYD70252.1 neutral zinc metallopeptidase [Azospirillum sp.]